MNYTDRSPWYMLRLRVRVAWKALRGRPVIANCSFNGGLSLDGANRGALVANNYFHGDLPTV